MEDNGTKIVAKYGAVSIIANKRKVLLLKRIWLPFITAPGKWTFVMGGKKKSETYNDCAIREVREETGITEDHLRLLHGPETVLMCEQNRPERWENKLFIFESDTDNVRLDIENRDYRWADPGELTDGKQYYNMFSDEKHVMRILFSLLE